MFDDGRYWVVDVDHAKGDADDLCMRIRVRNAGPDAATLHVLPQLWFRNTWSWGHTGDDLRPRCELEPDGAATMVVHPGRAGRVVAHRVDRRRRAAAEWLFCENETNATRSVGPRRRPGTTPYPKDGINDHVVAGSATVNPDQAARRSRPGSPSTVERRRHRRAPGAAEQGRPSRGP